MSRLRIALVALIAASLFVASCGGDSDTATVEDGGEVVIELTEYQFAPSTIEVTAGSTVTFVVRNLGNLRHEFMIGREVRLVDGVKDGFVIDFFHGLEPVVVPAAAVMEMDAMESDGDMGHGFMITRKSNEEARITVTVPADAVGDWEFGCFVEDGGHYEKGMMGTLVVTP